MRSARFLPLALAGLALSLSASVLRAEEYSFDIAETEKKPYHIGGYVEARPVLSGLDRDAAWYKLRFFDRDQGRTLPEYNAALLLEGSLEAGPAKLVARTATQYQDADRDATFKTTVYEGFLTVRPSPSLAIDAGKKALKWGKGYAWNPVAFIDRPKNPDDPDLSREGFVVASADWIRSFGGPLATLSLTPVLVPVAEHVNEDFGEADHLDAAGKVYLLLYDTDIDLLFLSGGSRTSRLGLDFSRNLGTNFEVHGEYARVEDQRRRLIAGDGSVRQSVSDVSSWLLGLRYLTAGDTTYVLEYYRNGAGYTEGEMREYLAFVHDAHESYRSSGSSALLEKAAAVAESYGRPSAGRSYGYLRVSQKEPFDMLYWTPAVTAIVNAEDGSCSLTPELSYTGITNVELRLKGTVLAGNRLSEFGEKPNDFRLELLARYYF